VSALGVARENIEDGQYPEAVAHLSDDDASLALLFATGDIGLLPVTARTPPILIRDVLVPSFRLAALAFCLHAALLIACLVLVSKRSLGIEKSRLPRPLYFLVSYKQTL
jgi:hypothetical protein